jgi:hypothetical protein
MTTLAEAREILDLTQSLGALNSNVAWIKKVIDSPDVEINTVTVRFRSRDGYRWDDFAIPGTHIDARAMVKAYSRTIEQKRTAIVLRLNQLGVVL